MESIWRKTVQMPEFEPMKQDRKTDVLVIGGGLTGLLCARKLAQEGVDYLLVEADRICGGVTRDTTAKITAQHGLLYHKLFRRFGAEITRLYLEANLNAVHAYEALCQTMDCDFQVQASYVYSRENRRVLEEELRTLQQLHAPAYLADALPLPFPTVGAVKFPKQAQFHPLKFAAALAECLNICENTKVLELAPGRAVTNRGVITANAILVATHFPMLNKHGGYFLKLYQHRSYVLALKNAQDVQGMYVDEAQTGLSFRNDSELLLLGGSGHRTGKQGGGWKELEAFAHCAYPDAQTVARWATQDCMSLDQIPYIGPYSKRTPGLYVASGYNKWGMTTAMVAAQLLTDLVLERPNPYAPVFSPARSMLHPQLAVNGAESVLGLLTPSAPRCPHLGCALKYNRQEHSWDCSCHGSRFTEDGKLINNPATDDLKPGTAAKRRSQ